MAEHNCLIHTKGDRCKRVHTVAIVANGNGRFRVIESHSFYEMEKANYEQSRVFTSATNDLVASDKAAYAWYSCKTGLICSGFEHIKITVDMIDDLDFNCENGEAYKNGGVSCV